MRLQLYITTWINYDYFPLDKLCDGIFHCPCGEDERYELCKKNFRAEATVECIENRVDGVDLRIKAVPCDGIKECRYGEDEHCDPSEVTIYFWLIGLYCGTFLIWCWIRYDVKRQIIQTVDHIDEPYARIDCRNFKGERLTDLKV